MTWKQWILAGISCVAFGCAIASLWWLRDVTAEQGRQDRRQAIADCRQGNDTKNAAYASLAAQEAVLDELFTIVIENNPEGEAAATLARARLQAPLEVLRKMIDGIETLDCASRAPQ